MFYQSAFYFKLLLQQTHDEGLLVSLVPVDLHIPERFEFLEKYQVAQQMFLKI